jgi:hypothetical protein
MGLAGSILSRAGVAAAFCLDFSSFFEAEVFLQRAHLQHPATCDPRQQCNRDKQLHENTSVYTSAIHMYLSRTSRQLYVFFDVYMYVCGVCDISIQVYTYIYMNTCMHVNIHIYTYECATFLESLCISQQEAQ